MKKFRKKIVAGNWKMNKTRADAAMLAEGIKKELANFVEVDVVLCPPFTALETVGNIIANTQIRLGAQNMHWEASGAYTGEISAGMLRDLYCRYVIIGHSERRIYFGETDATVNRKIKSALAATLTPIMCVGETLEERDAGKAMEVVKRQIEQGLADIGNDIQKIVIAYEPVWAIGTNRTATPAQAQEMHAFIREILASLAGKDIASSVRIQYGGSIKPSNARDLFSQPDVDGGLVGGASLEAESFIEIVKSAVIE